MVLFEYFPKSSGLAALTAIGDCPFFTQGERALFIFAMVFSSGWTPVRERLSSDSYSVWATEAM